MLEDGKITDAKGNTVSCEHTLIFLTSNLGKNQLNKFASKLGFTTFTKEKEENYESIKEQVMEVVSQKIKPEILGRISSKIVFRPIDKDVLTMIIQKELGILQNHLLRQGKTVSFDNKSVTHLVENAGSNFEYGAREVKVFLSDSIQNKLAEFILENPRVRNIQVSFDNEIVINKKTSK
jgi:ATP-dependent Clp protease ATP-binding subunit ClpA